VNKVKALGFSLAALLLCATAEGTAILGFSDYSSDETSPSDLDANVQFTVTGSQLIIDIDNQSDFQISQLYFNSDIDLTGLDFAAGSGANSKWKTQGGGDKQGKSADGFGKYNWLIDFGNDANRLPPGTTQLVLDMTGTTTEATIITKLSQIPPGDIQALAAIKFEAGPNADSAFGATITLVPEPTTFIVLGVGLLLLGLFYRKRQKK
jgi:hypothetical protein